jgi:hypothetical protein
MADKEFKSTDTKEFKPNYLKDIDLQEKVE